ncbi:UBA protein [Geosmithia morbida]|uniref:UBA protein n=1 Tax=Geosmithia morbida TaxID=1094350 RepID=A0A9P4YPI2_9HYPO|nr:UBA protein [Geosmithia morbida]KAF4119437.1 UBA protein [Geosmithia morbida]
MSGAMSKRQQVRNEKVLQELVQKVPGNNTAMRAAQNMRKVGNVTSNQIYNAENRKPPVPIDVEEADSAMERFIRQKYMNNVAPSSKRPTSSAKPPGSPVSDEGVPPPLPPKNSASKFGLRSASSLFPRPKKDSKLSLSPSPGADANRPASQGSNGKVSRMFGASVNYDHGDDLDRKLAKLRDMGFYDTQRNAIVLKGVSGNLEKAIQALVRLGEGDRNSYAPPPPPHDDVPPPARSSTPLSSKTEGGQTLGLSVRAQPTQDRLPSPAGSSMNPFEALSMPPAMPQTAQSTGSQGSNNPYSQSLNPFGVPTQPTDQFSQAFQNLGISAQSSNAQQQPLFPNRTGGLTPLSTVPPPSLQQVAPSAPVSPQATQHQQPHAATAQGTNNPFMNGGGAAAAAAAASTTDDAFTPRKASRESVNLGMDLAWTNGRHSPDAFASLSAKHG